MLTSTIVVIDDELEVANFQRDILIRAGYKVDVFLNAVSAWERIQEGTVALVVTDWCMPDMSGMDLLIKTRELALPPLVIFVTGYRTMVYVLTAMDEGAFNYLKKPFNLRHYLVAVNEGIQAYHRKVNFN